jgi:guanine nucleotide-binding protein alpha-1 subunit
MAPRFDEDPLTVALTPPRDESPAQREARERAELQARKVNDEIEEQIRLERTALKKKKRPVKVLLLGQSESGKSVVHLRSSSAANFNLKR